MRTRLLTSAVATAWVCLAAASCASNTDGSSLDRTRSDGGSAATAAVGNASAVGGGTAASNGSGAGSNIVPDILPDPGTTPAGEVCGSTCPAGGTCSPETCDGVDNNCDGQIDNLDANIDGICDCLLVATLGVPGTWGQGDVFATWLSARSNNGAANLADQILTPQLLAKYQVIVAQDVHKNHVYAADEILALQNWVKAGGGLMTLIGYSPPGDTTNVNLLLAPFAMNYGSKQILRGNGMTVPISEWTAHPIDQGVTAIGMQDGYEVQGTGTVIARSGGLNVGVAQDVLPGHVFSWADEWITYNSEWTQHPDYQVQLLWVNAIKWLTAANICQVPIPPVFPK